MTVIRFNTWRQPYRIVWKAKRPIKGVAPRLDGLSFMSKKDDVELTLTSQELEWSVVPAGVDGQYDISADGTVTIDVDASTLKELRKAGSIDHVVALYPRKADADRGINAFDSPRDYELVENSRVDLDIVEAPATKKGNKGGALSPEAIGNAVGLTSAGHMSIIKRVVEESRNDADGPIASLEHFFAALKVYEMLNVEKPRDRKLVEEIAARSKK